jgi:DNA-binding IclR family transcriptional regulator
MSEWSFLTNHARALLCIAHDPGARLRDLASALDITERTAYGIVADLTAAGYVVKEKAGRRNRYHIQEHLPLRESITRERTIGEVLDLLVDAPRPAAKARHQRRGNTAPASRSRSTPPTATPDLRPSGHDPQTPRN